MRTITLLGGIMLLGSGVIQGQEPTRRLPGQIHFVDGTLQHFSDVQAVCHVGPLKIWYNNTARAIPLAKLQSLGFVKYRLNRLPVSNRRMITSYRYSDVEVMITTTTGMRATVPLAQDEHCYGFTILIHDEFTGEAQRLEVPVAKFDEEGRAVPNVRAIVLENT